MNIPFSGKLRDWYLAKKAELHRANLNRVAVIGEEFCNVASEPRISVLSFRVQNNSGIRERVKVGRFCNLGVSILCDQRGSVEIGDYVYYNMGGTIRIAHGLVIGSHCLFGPGVVIWDTDSHPLSRKARHEQCEKIPNGRLDPYEAKGSKIRVGNDVWVCMDALILGGVTVGDGSIIAARSVVTQDVPPMSIVAGVPARVVGKVPA